VEASALHAPAIGRLSLSPAFLRLRSDEQLVALFRAGNDEAFSVIHDRYRQRLFAYVRQMMGAGSRQDAEDVLQDVFVRAYGALRADDREVLVRAWLYRVAHNRCIDVLRRPVPPANEIFEMSRKPLHDPIEEAQRRDDLARLVRDVGRLPEQQRSALLMREIDGMPYAEIATALGVTVPAVKSLLVRARMGLVEAQEAREESCAVIREDLAGAFDRGVKASGRARRHMRECSGCREYRGALRDMRKSFAALSPLGFAPLAIAAKALGIGGAGGAGAGAAGGGAAAAGGSVMAGATVCKVAAVVCTAAVTVGSADVVERVVHRDAPKAKVAATQRTAPDVSSPAGRSAALHSAAAAAPAPLAEHVRPKAPEPSPVTEITPAVEAPVVPAVAPTDTAAPADVAQDTGGATAPDEPLATDDLAGTPHHGSAGADADAADAPAEPTTPVGEAASEAPDEPAAGSGSGTGSGDAPSGQH
jgi:RNA polymerase sigma factor (sigma-70 family)